MGSSQRQGCRLASPTLLIGDGGNVHQNTDLDDRQIGVEPESRTPIPEK
jgi:hypothetical protein